MVVLEFPAPLNVAVSPVPGTGVADQLFLDDAETNLAAFIDYAEPEFVGQWPLPVQEAAA